LSTVRDELLGLQGARLHPDHFLHIMLQELGFVVDHPTRSDEIAPARLEEFALAATSPVSDVQPFPVALGGVNSFQDAVFLEIGQNEPLNQIHERLFDLAAVPHIPSYPFLAHCTIAHYDGSVSPQAARTVIESWRAALLGQFTATEIEIVTMDPGSAYPELQTYAAIPFAN
ncbi:MAG: 2'-5' RNA ligase family protein, partial [Chloroflexia bacterium]|nr:2'-5' RNA ligase family protein [Chloroflexia bacterium]